MKSQLVKPWFTLKTRLFHNVSPALINTINMERSKANSRFIMVKDSSGGSRHWQSVSPLFRPFASRYISALKFHWLQSHWSAFFQNERNAGVKPWFVIIEIVLINDQGLTPFMGDPIHGLAKSDLCCFLNENFGHRWLPLESLLFFFLIILIKIYQQAIGSLSLFINGSMQCLLS